MEQMNASSAEEKVLSSDGTLLARQEKNRKPDDSLHVISSGMDRCY
jgi:hypothetical protein